MQFKDILYTVDGPVATIQMNRPQYRNAQSFRLLDEIDAAFSLAKDDRAVRVMIVRGSGGNFSSGHDLGTPDGMEYRKNLGAQPGIETYDQFKKYNLDLLVRWRNFPKPTIAMVEGYCIYAGWMLAACLDLVFAAEDAIFLSGVLEYMSVPYDLGVKKAKEIVFESRFITAKEGESYGFINRVIPQAELERETYAYARRVAENAPELLRFAKIHMNKAQDAQGYSQQLEDSLGDYVAMAWMPGIDLRMEGGKRLLGVDLAMKGRKGERHGQKR